VISPADHPSVTGSAELQHALARRGQHRVPIPGLIISVAAKHARVVVLHEDSAFEANRGRGWRSARMGHTARLL